MNQRLYQGLNVQRGKRSKLGSGLGDNQTDKELHYNIINAIG